MKTTPTRLTVFLVAICSLAGARTKNRDLIYNISYIEATEVSKYDWNDPAANYLVLDNTQGALTPNELDGLKQYLLHARLPTHNHMNYYFRKRMNSYALEWLFTKDGDTALLNRSIEIARRAVAYRNDRVCQTDQKIKCYPISYDRSKAPVWPNYKELEVYEDGSHGLAPGASGFAGLPMVSIPVRMIAQHPKLWEHTYKGITYRAIALTLAAEAQKTLDYTYAVFVGKDHLIRYPETMQRSEWHHNVYIYNRVFPVMSGAIPLAEAYEVFAIHAEKVKQIDAVNQAMLDFLMDDMVFHPVNGKECLSYPYSDEAQEQNPEQSEDFAHGSFDSRDFQLFYKSGRYTFPDRIVMAMANTLVEVLNKGDGNFAARLNGKGSVKKGTPINFDGYIWYASYRPEVYPILIDYILKNHIAKKNGVYDANCIYEILKLKEAPKLVYSNDFEHAWCLNDWVMEGPGQASIKDGKLLIQSAYAQVTQTFLNQHPKGDQNGRGYYPFLENYMRKQGTDVEPYKMNGKFAGGHLVYWNKTPTPQNYILECDFQSLSPYALHMLMFSHLGIHGESVFDPRLKARTGLAAQYTQSDMVGYRISYYAPDRKTTHLRKSPEKALLAKGPDFTLDDPKATHHLKIIKSANMLRWLIDGKTALVYTQETQAKVLGGGYFAIRLMVPAVGLYDKVRIYQL